VVNRKLACWLPLSLGDSWGGVRYLIDVESNRRFCGLAVLIDMLKIRIFLRLLDFLFFVARSEISLSI
jgi:hypothetical protein